MMKTKITSLLGIQYPILQGAMAWIADSSLAGAVSQAGGLGILAAGNAPSDWIQNEIQKIRSVTDRPFGVNIMLLSPYVDEVVAVVCREKPAVVTLGAGSPGKYMEKLQQAGVRVIPVVPSVAFAKKMEKMGADAVVAEGMESGGHIGRLTTMALVPQVVDAVSIPVIAAGGIADGRGMSAAFMLGADGIQVGTRFLTADECTIHENYKNAVLKAKDVDTVITGQATGHPVRVLRNKLARKLEDMEKKELAAGTLSQEAFLQKFDELGKGALRRAVVDGDVDDSSLMAGQIAGMCSKKQSCADILSEIMEEFQQCLNRTWENG